METIKAKCAREGSKEYVHVGAEVNLGTTLQEMIELFGEKEVLELAQANATIAIQNRMRSLYTAGLSVEEIQSKAAAWKPGIRETRERIDPRTKVINDFKNMSDEARKEFLAALGVA